MATQVRRCHSERSEESGGEGGCLESEHSASCSDSSLRSVEHRASKDIESGWFVGADTRIRPYIVTLSCKMRDLA
jgi:hypothetical protein